MESQNINRDINIFLDRICTQLGICEPCYHRANLLNRDYYEAIEFSEEVLRIEGLDPIMRSDLLTDIKQIFIARFGTELIAVEVQK